MGNCVFKSGSRILSDEEDMLIRVVTTNGGVMELHPPITTEFITNEFPGHAIYQTIDSGAGQRSSPPLLHYEELRPGHLYYLLPITTTTAAENSLGQLTPYRMSLGHNARKTAAIHASAAGCNGGGVWKVRLVINPDQLADILAQDTKTEALIESVRTVAKCGSYGSVSRANSAVNSDQWSVTSSWKGYFDKSGLEDT